MPEQQNPKPAQPRRRRARNTDGTFDKGVEPVAIEREVSEKTVDYTVRPRVDGTSEPTAGKYGKKGKVRPTFGNVTTTYH